MSINDPNSGKNNNQPNDPNKDPQGPPDLEDLWREFNQRLGGAFGRNNSNSNGGGDPGQGGGGGGAPLNSRQFSGGVLLVVMVTLVLWLCSGFYVVDARERAIVLRFGKAQAVTTGGLQWRLPFPIESHEIVKMTDLQTVEVGYRGADHGKDSSESLMLTDDENIINIQFAVQFTLNDPSAYLFNNRDPKETVKQVAETSMREIVGKSKMDFVLYEGREAIAKDAQVLMQKILDEYKSGIQVNKVMMANAQPPEQVQESFNDAVKASQDQERLKNEGQAYYNDLVPKAKGTAIALRTDAEGYAAQVVSRAEGDAARFKSIFAEYAKAPEVTRNRMYIDAMQEMYRNTTKIMIDAKSNGSMLYLPLDKIMQMTASNGTPVDTAAPSPGANAKTPPVAQNDSNSTTTVTPSSTTRTADTDYRSRDGLRSRDRGDR